MHLSRIVLASLLALLPTGLAQASMSRGTEGPHEAPAPTIEQLVAKHAHDVGVPVGLAKALIGIESRGNPQARNHGAMGLMQIKAETARALGFQGEVTGLLSPDTNLTYGMKVLAAAYKAESGDLCRTLAFYRSGHHVRGITVAQRRVCTRARTLMAHA